MLCFLREGRDIVRLESLPRLRVYRLLGIKKTGEYTHFVRHQKTKVGSHRGFPAVDREFLGLAGTLLCFLHSYCLTTWNPSVQRLCEAGR